MVKFSKIIFLHEAIQNLKENLLKLLAVYSLLVIFVGVMK
jgi:hypothetical protein